MTHPGLSSAFRDNHLDSVYPYMLIPTWEHCLKELKDLYYSETSISESGHYDGFPDSLRRRHLPEARLEWVPESPVSLVRWGMKGR